MISDTIENSTEILTRIRSLVSSDLDAVDHLIHQELATGIPLTRDIIQHILQGGGKRLRPLLVILAANAFKQPNMPRSAHHELATVIEFVHTATLLHDDVVDNSNMRRGQETANAIWSNQACVLVGDFLYSRAFQLLARGKQHTVMQVLSETTNAIADGELMQLMNQNDPDLTEENYFHVITQKTAKLFATSAEIGTILGNASRYRQAMQNYGLHLGIAFQIIDDLLDYQAETNVSGKNIGDDLAEGKATLPLIYAMQYSSKEKADCIRDAIKKSNVDALPKIMTVLKETDALTKTKNKALEEATLAEAALSSIPDSVYRDAMKSLIEFAVQRCY